MRKMLYLIIAGMSLVIIVFCIKDADTHLKKIEATTNAEELTQYDDEQEVSGVLENSSYTIDREVTDVDKPRQRTREEALQRLSELGRENAKIERILENSDQYPEELLEALANNPEMADFAAGYLDVHNRMSGELTKAEKEQEFPLFLQWDARWGYQAYGDSIIGLAGCGPTCLAMAMYYLTRDERITPDKVSAYAMDNHYYVEGTGTAWLLMENYPPLLGITVTKPPKTEKAMKDALDRGGVIICAMRSGDFTASGHFIVIYGYDKNGFKVNDPNCVARSKRRWSFEQIEYQINGIWAYENRG